LRHGRARAAGTAAQLFARRGQAALRSVRGIRARRRPRNGAYGRRGGREVRAQEPADAAESAAEAVEALGGRASLDPHLLARIETERGDPGSGAPVGALGCASSVRRDRAWVDFAHDVEPADVDLAARESFVSVEHLKRYTTAGMAIDQGRTSNLNAIAILGERTAALRARSDDAFSAAVPVALGAIASGRLGPFLRPTRPVARRVCLRRPDGGLA
jgi:sarcosine oxidase subunit alpha